MLITATRIRSLARHLSNIQPGTTVVPAIVNLESHRTKLREFGFPDDLQAGESLLPPASGPISSFNAEGKFLLHKDQPKETAYRQIEWTRMEWRGRYDRVEVSDIRDVPYERYPRTFVEPPSVELTVAQTTNDGYVIATLAVPYSPEAESRLLHQINLLLELFGECEVLDESLTPIIRAPVNRLNWEVLPRGEMPWEQLADRVRPLIDRMPGGNQPVARHRLKTLNDLGPDFIAIGRAGFRGYLIFAFEEARRYIVESLYYGNATYVFGQDWRELSQMTKADILRESLQEDRIIHRLGWEAKVRRAAQGSAG